MTLQNQDSTVTHNGNGLTKVWPYSFRIPDPESLRVGLFDIATSALTLLTPSDFTVTGLGEDDGGEVTYPLGFIDAIGADKRLVIYREVPYTQAIDLTNQTYYPETLEDQLDLIVMQIQKLAEESNRALKVTLGASLEPDEFISQLQAGAAIATEQAGIATTQAAAAIAAAESVDAATIVHYTAETKTEAERGQARANIDAGVMAGYRNKIINGNFDLFQRGTSQAVSGYASVDRFLLSIGTGAAATMTRSVAAQSILDSGFANTLQLDRTTSGTGPTYIDQPIEDVNTLSGRKATFTIWMRAPLAAAPVAVDMELFQIFGAGGSANVDLPSQQVMIPVGNAFLRYDAVFDIPTTFGKVFGANHYLLARLTLPTAAGVVRIDTARWSLVEGDATAEVDPFAARPIAIEDAMCRRYYNTTLATARFYASVGGGNALCSTQVYFPKMHATPTVVIISPGSQGNLAVPPTITADGNNSARFEIVANATGDTYALNTGISMSAEL